MSIADKVRTYREAADRMRIAALAMLQRETGTRNITLLAGEAKELWERAEQGETEIRRLKESIAHGAQRRGA
jgi:hypothetical protein